MQAYPILQIENTQLGEGPVWDYRSQKLWWVDIPRGVLHVFDPKDSSNQSYPMGQMLGAAIPCENSGLVLAMQHGFAFFDPAKGTLQPICDPEIDQPLNRFNDGKCDPAGRLWAGTMMIEEPRAAVGNLYCLDQHLHLSKQQSGIIISNGMAWSKDVRKMYYIDTMTHKVQSFHFNLETGHIEKDQDILQFDPSRLPDGMCIDENDHLWIAFFGGGCIGCFDPNTGKQIAQVEVPASRTTSCTFGGDQLDTLYITSAAQEGEALGGALFAVQPGVKGRPASFFKGVPDSRAVR